MNIKVKIFKINNKNYLYIKFNNIDKKEILFSAEIKKKTVFETKINIENLNHNEFFSELNVSRFDSIWFYYYYNNRKNYVKYISDADVERIDYSIIPEFFFTLTKNELLENIQKVGDFI